MRKFFEEFDIDLGFSGTGSYSSWHKAIMDKYNVHFMATADIGTFFRCGNKVFKVDLGDFNRLREYFSMLAEMYNNGDVNKNDVRQEIDAILNGNDKTVDAYLQPCQDLDSFEDDIRQMTLEIERNGL